MRAEPVSGYAIARRKTTARLQLEAAQLAAKPKRKSKYGAVKETVDGIVFHSKKEANYYRTLMTLEKIGRIWELQLQPRFDIIINGQKCGFYKADFSYYECPKPHGSLGVLRIIDVKGLDTALSKFKRKCVEAQYNIQIELA